MVFSAFKKILYWAYERGSWQYDLLCVLILAFVFLAPNTVFHSGRLGPLEETYERPIFIPATDIAGSRGQLERDIAQYLARKYGRTLAIGRIEPHEDESGEHEGYLVWEK